MNKINHKWWLLCILPLIGLACNLTSLIEGPAPVQIEYDQEVARQQHTKEASIKATQTFLHTTPDFIWEEESQQTPALEKMDVEIVFSYAGENQSFHTGLRNKTIFYVDYDSGTVIANEQANFEEPSGIQTSQGTDSVQFSGTYDDKTKMISGNLSINTQSTITGGDSSSTIAYAMVGILSAKFENGQWQGTVIGTSTLTQTWPGQNIADSITPYNIAWTITGTQIE